MRHLFKQHLWFTADTGVLLPVFQALRESDESEGTQLRKSQLDYFRSKARETNLEIQAYLIGEVISPELTVVEAFAYPRHRTRNKNPTPSVGTRTNTTQ
jgi:hypothetical protein